LGWRFAQVLAACGAAVAATGRRADRLDALAAEITREGGTCLPLPLDVTEAAQLTTAVDTIEKALGTVSILVNNAAIPDAQYATRMSVELVDRVIATNLRAPFLLSSEIARRLIARREPGRIVNVSSMGAHHYRGEAGSLYSTTKAAMERMTETLAVEWAPFHINVNAVAPGAFDTEMLRDMIQRHGEVSSGFPRQRLGDPAQLDSTLLYLVSPTSEFVTGTIVKVDDGQNPR
jgi:NAD(P)-dependent dehydrogenase (short-subunit alcohol dehydrogenase family)